MPLKLTNVFVLIVVLLFSGCGTSHAMHAQIDISCDLSASQQPNSADEVMINFRITNNSEQSLKLLTWYTPLEGLFSDLFLVKDSEGHLINYHGIMVKRNKPQESDYLLLTKGFEHQVKINLALGYAFKAGQYQVMLKDKPLQVLTNEEPIYINGCRLSPISIIVD